jgi:hypothetical protein
MSITAFAIAPNHNTGGKNDATGAFLPGAQKFGKAYSCPWRQFDNTGAPNVVRKRFYDTIETHCPSGTNLFAYFGHGIAKGLASPHVYGDNLDDLLKILKPKISKPFVAVLYACSSGAAQGFSGKFRDKLGGDVWVYGHTSVGHAFLNPDVSEEASGNSPTWRMLYPSGDELRAAWADALKYTDLWLRFPLLEDDDIYAEVNARRLLGTWEVNSSGATSRYVFDMPATTWSVDSDQEIDEAPSGTVKAVDPKKRSGVVGQGTWEITDELSITWDSGSEETWPLPLRTVGQQGTADSAPLSAKRLSHSEGHGKIQG